MTDLPPPAAPPAGGPPPTDPGVEPRRRLHVVLAWVLSVVGVLIVVAVIAGFVIHVPYVIISPGNSTPLDRSVVSIDGATTYPHRTPVEFLTVRVSNEDPTYWRYLLATLDPDRDVEKRESVVGCLSDRENQQFNTDLMDQSQNDARYVALTRLGYQVEASDARLTVVQACKGVPAYGRLEVGDRIVAVDGTPVTAGSAVGSAVQAHTPGDDVAFTVVRNGVEVHETVTTGQISKDRTTCVRAGNPERSSRAGGGGASDPPAADGQTSGSEAGKNACVGIVTQPFVDYTFPIDVRIDTARVGGPSAGLAFTLAIIDDLTPGSLTGGKRVAVTGTISPDGKVGAVGGVEQKAITARTNGVQLMLVPKAEVRDARRGAGDVRVVGVDTVDEALAALQDAGGAAVPPTTTSAARS